MPFCFGVWFLVGRERGEKGEVSTLGSFLFGLPSVFPAVEIRDRRPGRTTLVEVLYLFETHLVLNSSMQLMVVPAQEIARFQLVALEKGPEHQFAVEKFGDFAGWVGIHPTPQLETNFQEMTEFFSASEEAAPVLDLDVRQEIECRILGGDFKPEIEPSAKRLDPILGQVLTDLKNYLSSVNLTQTEEFNKTVATFR